MLNESLSDIIYHFTDINALINIIKTNKLMMSHVFSDINDEYINRGRFFYFSTTRDKRNDIMSLPVKIVLNGRLLNREYKGGAVNYFGKSDKSNKNKKSKGSELEDRLFTDKPFIPNALKYILEIHIFLNGDNVISPELAKVANEAEKNSTPIFYYNNKKYWLNNQKGKALDSVKVGYAGGVSGERKVEVSNSIDLYNLMRLVAYGNEYNLSALLNKVEDREGFVRDMEEQKDLFRPSLYGEDKEIYYRAIAFANRKPDDIVRFVLTLIVGEMRKLKIKYFMDYVRYKFYYNSPNKYYFNEKIFELMKTNIQKRFSDGLMFELTKTIPITMIVDGRKITYNNLFEVSFIREYLKSKLADINYYIWDLVNASDGLFSGGLIYISEIKKKIKIDLELHSFRFAEIIPNPGYNIDSYNEILIKILNDSIEWGFKASYEEIKKIHQEYNEKL